MTEVDGAGAIERRKAEHLELAVAESPDPTASGGWDDIALLHDALPDVDADSIDLTGHLLGRRLGLPLVIAGMTGGHAGAMDVNARLADAAADRNLAIGVGSQRAALRDPRLEATYAIVRERAPDAVVIANIGVSQLLDQDDEARLTPDDVDRIVKMIDADVLAVHLNYVEELVQPEGQTRSRGALQALRELVGSTPVPVMVKEVGNGLSRAVAERVREAGAAALDVGGLGGTSFARIEAERAAMRGDAVRAALGRSLCGWGVPTAVAVRACAPILPTVATGGVRDGLDAAKALALGATVVGVGRPLLVAAMASRDALDQWLGTYEAQLRAAVMLTGGTSVQDLRGVPYVVGGATSQWLDQLGWGER